MDNFDESVQQVLAIDGSKSKSDVIVDLKYTKSVSETINRILDGLFLKGTERDPSKSAPLIILDSDDEDEQQDTNSSYNLPEASKKTTLSSYKNTFDFDFDDDNDYVSQSIPSTSSNYNKAANLSKTPTQSSKPKPAKSSNLFDVIDDTDDPLLFSSQEQDGIELNLPLSSTHFSKNKGKSIDTGTDKYDNFILSPTQEDNSGPDPFDFVDDLTASPKRSEYTKRFNQTPPSRKSNAEKEYDPFHDIDELLRSPEQPENTDQFDFCNDKDDISASREKIKETRSDESDAFDLTSLDSPSPSNKDDYSTHNSASESTKKKSSIWDDSDDDVFESIPSREEFLDQLIAKPRKRKPVELSDEEDSVTSMSQGKGKKRAYEFNLPAIESVKTNALFSPSSPSSESSSLTSKERKKLEAEERKRQQNEAKEEKKQQRILQLELKKKEKERKQLEKERQQIFEKENRVRSNRDKVLKEMIVDMHPDFVTTKAGQILEIVLNKKEAEVRSLLSQDPNPKYHIAWRRKCRADWHQESQTFIPLSHTKVISEPYILVYADVADFLDYIKSDQIDTFIDEIESSAGKERQVIILMEGLELYYKEKLKFQRRQFEDGIRQCLDPAIGGGNVSTGRRKKGVFENIGQLPVREEVEECLNYLMIIRNIMFVHTKDDEDTASWIESLTTDLALGRYKTRNLNNSFKVGKSSIGADACYSKMLQEIQLCTPAIANSVMAEYPTVQSLHRAYKRTSKAAGEMLLADLEVIRSSVSAKDRKINRVMSKKIYSIFNSNDPEYIVY